MNLVEKRLSQPFTADIKSLHTSNDYLITLTPLGDGSYLLVNYNKYSYTSIYLTGEDKMKLQKMLDE